MPPKKKFRRIRRKKRNFTGNMYTQPQDSQQSAATATDSSPQVSEAAKVSSESCVGPKILVPASLRKLDLSNSSEDESDTPVTHRSWHSYRNNADVFAVLIVIMAMWS